MIFRFRSVLSSMLLPVVAFMLMVPFDVLAQDHVTTTNDLRNELLSASKSRQENVAVLQKLLETDGAQKMMASARIDPVKAKQAVSLLSDQELARLASQVDRSEFAGAGISLTNQQVTIILLGVILIIVIAIIASR